MCFRMLLLGDVANRQLSKGYSRFEMYFALWKPSLKYLSERKRRGFNDYKNLFTIPVKANPPHNIYSQVCTRRIYIAFQWYS